MPCKMFWCKKKHHRNLEKGAHKRLTEGQKSSKVTEYFAMGTIGVVLVVTVGSVLSEGFNIYNGSLLGVGMLLAVLLKDVVGIAGALARGFSSSKRK